MALTRPNERLGAGGIPDAAVRRAHAAAAQARRSRLIARFPHLENSSDPSAGRWSPRTRLVFLVAVTSVAWSLMALGVIALLR